MVYKGEKTANGKRRKLNDKMMRRGEEFRRRGTEERSDYTKQARGMTVICVVLCCAHIW